MPALARRRSRLAAGELGVGVPSRTLPLLRLAFGISVSTRARSLGWEVGRRMLPPPPLTWSVRSPSVHPLLILRLFVTLVAEQLPARCA